MSISTAVLQPRGALAFILKPDLLGAEPCCLETRSGELCSDALPPSGIDERGPDPPADAFGCHVAWPRTSPCPAVGAPPGEGIPPLICSLPRRPVESGGSPGLGLTSTINVFTTFPPPFPPALRPKQYKRCKETQKEKSRGPWYHFGGVFFFGLHFFGAETDPFFRTKRLVRQHLTRVTL